MNMIFYILSVIIILSATAVVTLKNVFHSALALILTLTSIAGIYFLLNADFIAGVQILIYVGAITILMIFAIMLTFRITDKSIKQTNEQVFISFLTSAGLGAILITTLIKINWPISNLPPPPSTTAKIGELLLIKFVLPFEVASVVLLVALIGAIILARQD